jgi:hypothetical protein
MMQKRLLLTSVICLWLLAGATACSHYRAATSLRSSNLRVYEGTAREKGEVGYLKCSASELEIAEVDGRPLKELQAKYGDGGEYSYLELLPGQHSVKVAGSSFDTSQKRFHTDFTIDIASYTHATTGESTLKFTVEAGHVYLIDSEIEKADKVADAGSASHVFRIFIKDAQTKRIIAEDKREIVRRSTP